MVEGGKETHAILESLLNHVPRLDLRVAKAQVTSPQNGLLLQEFRMLRGDGLVSVELLAKDCAAGRR